MKINIFLIIFLFLILIPLSIQAMPCHCFSARDFDLKKPEAADQYFLATSQNSFFSVVFNIEKKRVVFAKQKPNSTAEGLWVLYWLSLTTGKDTDILNQMKKEKGVWLDALAEAKVENTLPTSFKEMLQWNANEKQLAQYIVDTFLVGKGLTTQDVLQTLRNEGASNEETILASLLAKKTDSQPLDILTSVLKGETTWGTLLYTSGMDGKNMVEEIHTLLKTCSKT